jgi:hypothetical protein
MASYAARESSGVIHELFAGSDEQSEQEGQWMVAANGEYYFSHSVECDPVYATAEEAKIEERLEADLQAGLARVRREELAAQKAEAARLKKRRKPERVATAVVSREAFDPEKFKREMERKTLNLVEFRGALRAGGLRSVHLVAEGPIFTLQGEPQVRPGKSGQSGRLTLVTVKGRVNHQFLHPMAALEMLFDLGVQHVQVDLEGWRPRLRRGYARRLPDMAVRLQLAHAYAREGGSEGKADAS